MITWENYEEYMMMHADGELQAAEVRELKKFVDKHPQLKSEMADLERVRFVPDTTVVYANKESLLKSEKRVIAFPAWRKYSIAAGVAAILFISLYRIMTGDNNSSVMASNTGSVVKPVANPVNSVKPVVTVAPENTAIARNDVKEIKKEKVVVPHEAAAHQQAPQLAHQQQVSKQVPVSIQPVQPIHVTEQPIAQLPVASVNEIAIAQASTVAVNEKEVPGYTVSAPATEKRSLWDKLPIDNIKKKELGNIADAIKQTADGDKLSIKVEKRRLVLSF